MAAVLIVDDEASVRAVLRRVLEAGGYTVVEAENGVDAGEQLRAGRPSLMITDMIMPEQDGIDTIRAARGLYPDMPILAITGGWEHADAGLVMTIANSLGATRVLRKPFEIEELRAAVAALLSP